MKIFVIFLLLMGMAAAQAPPPQALSNGPAAILREQVPLRYSGSVPPAGGPTGGVMDLSLTEAISCGRRYNLGTLVSRDIAEVTRAERQRSLSALLPSVSAAAEQTSQQINLVAFGFNLPGFPGISGPFGYQNVRAYFQQTVYDRRASRNLKSVTESVKAADLTAEDARNLVVQAVSNAYLAVITSAARADAVQAEITTAQALFDRASDQKKAGTVPGIDVLRAEVQLRSEQQRLLAQKNQIEKDKLTLARAVGLASGQQFRITDQLPFAPLTTALPDLLKQAYDHRADFRAAQANIRAAEFAVDAAQAEKWPTVVVAGDYGDIGKTLASSHGSYSLVAGVRVPLYTGGRTQSEIEQAMVVLRTKKNVLEELRGRIDYEIRNAVLDLDSAGSQVEVAKKNAELANMTLLQARDRFAAGVTENIEVIQAQQLLAGANEANIASLNQHSAAKIALAAALGMAEEGVPQFLNLK